MNELCKALAAQEKARMEAMREFAKPLILARQRAEAVSRSLMLQLQAKMSLSKGLMAEHREKMEQAQRLISESTQAYQESLASIRFPDLPEIHKNSEPAELTPKKRIGFRFED